MFSDELNKLIEESERVIFEIEKLKKGKKEVSKEFEKLNKDFNKEKIGKGVYEEKLKKGFRDGSKVRDSSKVDVQIRNLLEKLKKVNEEVVKLFEIKEHVEKKLEVSSKEIKTVVERLKKKKKVVEKVNYSTYSYNLFGRYANLLFEDVTKVLVRKYPEYFKPLYFNLRLANIRVFSNTYINLGLMGSVALFILVFISGFFIFGFGPLDLIKTIMLSIFAFGGALFGFYYYPKVIMDTRKREIKNDLPFAILHMAAVAGSGGRLVDIFGMLLKSDEYKALSGEIKRIMNYVNLFGYNLTTALKLVAETTPSDEFKNLLNGMVGSIGTGGNIKTYLKSKAQDTLIRYRLERKKYVETLSTYSDIYTALLIAAPLLFVIVLVLISIVGSKLGGLEISFIEKIGTFVVVPAMNVGFIVFMNIVQPDL